MRDISAGGGVLFKTEGASKIDVLLIFRRGVWDLPKGKQDEGEDIRECAVREVSEEVGCESPVIEKALGTTYHEYMEDGEHIGKTTHWYAMTTEAENFKPETEEGIEKVRWFSLSEAGELVGYDNLLKVLSRLENWLRKDTT